METLSSPFELKKLFMRGMIGVECTTFPFANQKFWLDGLEGIIDLGDLRLSWVLGFEAQSCVGFFWTI